METEDGADTPASPVPGWVQAAAAGDVHAWEQLVDHYSDLLWSVCRARRLSNADAADVVQLTWLRLLENLGRIRDPQRLAGWLATTCRRECQALQRRSHLSVTVPEESMERLLGRGTPADEPVLTAVQHALLWEAFRQLSEWCQRVLRALIVDPDEGPPSYALVAARLNTSPGSLGPTRARCLSQLRKLLDSDGI